jgi:hypothetical protein
MSYKLAFYHYVFISTSHTRTQVHHVPTLSSGVEWNDGLQRSKLLSNERSVEGTDGRTDGQTDRQQDLL